MVPITMYGMEEMITVRKAQKHRLDFHCSKYLVGG